MTPEQCDLCHRVADVHYRLIEPLGMVEFFCGRCANAVLGDRPASDYAGLVAV